MAILNFQMKIEPLEHKHRYRFRVRAVNKIGRSDPCEMLGDDILIKDPWGEFLTFTKYHCNHECFCKLPVLQYFLLFLSSFHFSHYLLFVVYGKIGKINQTLVFLLSESSIIITFR